MGSLIKLPVFLFASAIALSDGRKASSASAARITSSETHIAHPVEPQQNADIKVWSNNLAAKLAKAGTGHETSDQGRSIDRLSEPKNRSDT